VPRAHLAALFAPLLLCSSVRAQETAPIQIHRTSERITVDGDLSDPGWKGAAVVDRFYETSPGDNVEPQVKTTAYVTYDDKFFYIGVKCDDPEPGKIRAPYVDRDNVLGTDDNIAVFLDTRNDHRSAFELRVNPRGVQGDAIFNDASGNEDFSPDFFYDTAAKLTAEGWQAEYRIPFSSLRYPKADPQTWGILIWRNYPRAFRYAYHSSRIPRGASCLVCFTREMTGLTGLPGGGHVVAAPYFTAKESGHPRDRGDLVSEFVNEPVKADAGLDVKWNPGANTTLDATINPDFSQVESDVPQLSVNNRFALFYPEKRPFFLEGVDLFDTPIQAVYTRTITSPRWGGRVTGKAGGAAYTVLVTQDRGGGSVVVPGPNGNDFAPQDYRSTVVLARLREDIGRSYAGLLFTDREIEAGGHHRLLGPDFQWRASDGDTVTGQVVYSDSSTPDMGGARTRDHALRVNWAHNRARYDWFVEYKDFGRGFRADEGFVPQVGHREVTAVPALRFYPHGVFSFLRPYLILDYGADRDDRLITRSTAPGFNFNGWKNLTGFVELRVQEKVRVNDRLLGATFLSWMVQIDPSRRFTRVAFSGYAGDAIDFANARVGTGTTLMLTATVRPTDHLQLDGVLDRSWLDVTAADGREGRLFTADIARLKATYNFTARAFLRVIGQYIRTKRDPAIYTFGVPERDGSFLGSALFSYKVNWQTVFFLGYGDTRLVTERNDLVRSDRQLFLKISYAFQR
jgi:hypothetical protein